MPIGSPAVATAVSITNATPTTVLSGILSAFDDLDYPDVIRANQGAASVAQVVVLVEFNITFGAGTTSMSAKVFDQTGRQIGTTRTVDGVAADATEDRTLSFVDNAPHGVNSYSFQLTCNGATATSTVNVVNGATHYPG